MTMTQESSRDVLAQMDTGKSSVWVWALEHHCQRCGNHWFTKGETKRPPRCPTCRARTWDSPKSKDYSHYCLRCKHDWVSGLEKPKRCSRCRTYLWNKPLVRSRRYVKGATR